MTVTVRVTDETSHLLASSLCMSALYTTRCTHSLINERAPEEKKRKDESQVLCEILYQPVISLDTGYY